jgi:hypothetical protein
VNSEFFVLVPTSKSTDYTWLLQFNGLAGKTHGMIASSQGLPAPNSAFSETMTGVPVPPKGQFKIYLNPPEIARGGTTSPSVRAFKLRAAALRRWRLLGGG